MIITTTNSVDGYTVVSYFPPVSASLVAGTGLFNDLIAGFTDTFGGKSETYQRHFSDLHAEAIQELEIKAARLGANAVIGARFNLDQISGKGMQMFMLNAFATPVVIKTPLEIADGIEAEVRAKAEREAVEAGRRARFAGVDSLLGLLADPELAAQARDLRRTYGRGVCASFLTNKAADLGLQGIEITEDDIPDTF